MPSPLNEHTAWMLRFQLKFAKSRLEFTHAESSESEGVSKVSGKTPRLPGPAHVRLHSQVPICSWRRGRGTPGHRLRQDLIVIMRAGDVLRHVRRQGGNKTRARARLRRRLHVARRESPLNHAPEDPFKKRFSPGSGEARGDPKTASKS